MKFFSVDSPFYKFMSRFWDMAVLNFLWFICCIPIITIGPSTVAAFTVTLKMVDEEEGYIARNFFKAFKANLKQGIPLGLIAIVCVIVVNFDFQLFNVIEGNPMMPLIVGMFSLTFFIMGLVYAFPLMARYENTLVNTIKNSFKLSIRYFGRTLAMIFILLVEIFIFTFPISIIRIFGLIIGPACLILTISGFALFIFRKTESKQNSSNGKTGSGYLD